MSFSEVCVLFVVFVFRIEDENRLMNIPAA